MCPVQFLQPVENSFGAVWELKIIILHTGQVFFISFFFFVFLFLLDKRFTKDRLTFWNQVWCEIIHLTGLWKFGLQCLFKLWCCGGKPSVFFLILGIFPMFWRVMIFYSKPHGRPCLLNLSTKANGVVPVLTVIKMSGLARVFWSIIR